MEVNPMVNPLAIEVNSVKPMALETKRGRGSRGGGRLSFDGQELTADEVGLRVSDSFYEHVGHSTKLACFLNLGNTILGAGMLGMPFAYSNSGYVQGLLLMTFAAAASAMALHFLASAALSTKLPSSFYSVAEKALPSFTVLIDSAVAIKCFGVATSYLIVIGDQMPDVMAYAQGKVTNAGVQRRELWIVIGWCLIAPICFLKNLDSLKFTSAAAFVFVAFMSIMIVLYSLGEDGILNPCADVDVGATCKGSYDNFDSSLDAGKVFPIFIFAFTCHQNIFAVVNEIQTPAISEVNKVIVGAIGVALILYIIICITGYNTFGDETNSDILLNYPRNLLTSIARVFVSLLVMCCYPLQQHPARRSIMSIISLYYPSKQDNLPETKSDINGIEDADKSIQKNEDNEDSIPATESVELCGYDTGIAHRDVNTYIVTIIFLLASLIIALSVKSLGLVLGFVGATGSTMVSYILPGFCFYYIFKDEAKAPKWKLYLSFAQGVLGLILIPVCLTFLFM